MTTQQDQEQTSNGVKNKRLRSPAYPAIDLPEALQKAEAIRIEEGKNPTNVDTALYHWGYKPKNGTGLVALSALIKFGLLEDEGSGDERRVKLTPLALKILLDNRPESPERLAAIRETALMPSIHAELWKKYQGVLPFDTTLSFYLRHDRSFQDEAAERCIKVLRSTLTYARLPESGIISSQAEDKSEPDGELKMTQPQTIVTHMQEADEQQAQNTKLKVVDSTKRVNRTVQIPLTGAPWALLQIPFPMTDDNWAEMQKFLELMKKPLTTNDA